LGFLESGQLLSAASEILDVSGSVKIWDPQSGKLLHDLDSLPPWTLSPDGKCLFSAGRFRDTTVRARELDVLFDDHVQQTLQPIEAVGGEIRRTDGTYHITLRVNGIDSVAALTPLRKFARPYTLNLRGSCSFLDHNLAALAGDEHLKALHLEGLRLVTDA